MRRGVDHTPEADKREALMMLTSLAPSADPPNLTDEVNASCEQRATAMGNKTRIVTQGFAT
jgi:hypothetical protein